MVGRRPSVESLSSGGSGLDLGLEVGHQGQGLLGLDLGPGHPRAQILHRAAIAAAIVEAVAMVATAGM